tara:strand:+ start:1595 stop:3256 length:1662 start_codon:yes stop_codon:yes gene_type:complete
METKVSARVRKGLQKKVDDHNKKYGDDKRKRATLRMLIAVFRRGVGAYNTNPQSVRPSVTSSDQWAYARVNSFLYCLRTLKFRGGKFDTDLLPSAHPLSSKSLAQKGKYDDLDFSIPKGAKEEAKRGLDWVKEFNRGGTSVGRNSARYILNNQTAGSEKVRHIAKYFPRHEVDKQAEGWRPGEKGYPSNGRIAWALWGGEAGKTWSQKLVRGMNKRDKEEKFESARDLIARRDLLRKQNWDIRLNRFRSAEVKDFLWKQYDTQLSNWDFVLASEYYKLLRGQVSLINKYVAEIGAETDGLEAIVGAALDRQVTEKWYNSLEPLYFSMVLDFTYAQITTFLPDEVKSNSTFTPTEQEDIVRARRRKPRQEIITQGFHPRRRGGASIPIERTSYNREAQKFIAERLNQFTPDMSNTMKKNLNTALRRSYDEAVLKGLTGKAREQYIANGIKKSLGKKNLDRALLIARTEGLALSQEGQLLGIKNLGIQVTKEWITQRDGRVRDAHIAVDKQEVGENENFTVAGYSMKYPGDSSNGAPAGLICNCRCSIIYHEKKV